MRCGISLHSSNLHFGDLIPSVKFHFIDEVLCSVDVPNGVGAYA